MGIRDLLGDFWDDLADGWSSSSTPWEHPVARLASGKPMYEYTQKELAEKEAHRLARQRRREDRAARRAETVARNQAMEARRAEQEAAVARAAAAQKARETRLAICRQIEAILPEVTPGSAAHARCLALIHELGNDYRAGAYRQQLASRIF